MPTTLTDAVNTLVSNTTTLQTTVTGRITDMDGKIASADTAKQAAETAKAGAEIAKSAADTAKTNAETAQTLAENAKIAAETAQGIAATAKTDALIAQTASETSKNNAVAAQSAAESAEGLSQQWATKTTGAVDGGEYSAKYHAVNASADAAISTTKASEASSSASAAASSASSASSAASTAAASAASAATTAVNAVIDTAPANLNTLNELAAALGDDANFAATVTNSIGTKLPLAGGTMTGDVSLGTNVKAKFGASDDLQIYHDGGNTYIKENGTGDLRIKASNLSLQDSSGYDYIACSDLGNAGEVEIKYAGLTKLATTSNGMHVTNGSAGAYTAESVADNLIVEGSTSTGISIASPDANNATLDFGSPSDSDYARLQGYYNSGDPLLRVRINNAEVAEFSSSGIDVTGDIKSSKLKSSRDSNNVFVDFVDSADASDTNGDVVVQGYYPIVFKTDLAHERLRIERTGDTVFYKDTGSEGMRWDASAQRLGIGTSSPSEKLYVSGTSGDTRIGLNAPTGSDTEIKFSNNGSVQYSIGHDDATDNFVIGTANVDSPLVNIDKAGNMGLGNTPRDWIASYVALDIGSAGRGSFYNNTANNTTGIANNAYYLDGTGWAYDTSREAQAIEMWHDGSINFKVASTGNGGNAIAWKTAMKIDVSGNFYFGGNTSSTTVLSLNTASGSDTKQLSLAGGGADSDGRGARFRLYGNNHATLGGAADISTGNIAGCEFNIRAKGNVKIWSDGNNILNLSKYELSINTGSTSFAAKLNFGDTSTRATIQGGYGSGGGGNLQFHTDTTGGTPLERVRINNIGDTGFGTSNPQSRIDVGGGYMANEQGRTDHVANTMPSPYYTFKTESDLIYTSGSSNFSLSVGSFELWARFESLSQYNGLFRIGSGTSNYLILRCDGGVITLLGENANTGTVSIAYDLPTLSKWIHITGVQDGAGWKVYYNGVEQTGSVTQNGTQFTAHMATPSLNISDSEWTTRHIDADVSGLRVYNTALTADEVKGLYSGASVPFKYKGASQTELVTNGDFAAGSTGWTSGAGWDTSTGVAVATAAEGNLVQYNVFTLGKSYRLTFDFTYTSGSLHVWAGSNQNIVASLTGNGTKTYEFVCRDVTASARLLFEDSAFTGSIDNVSVVQIGAVAEYDGSSATTGTWYDKSGNGLDGTVTGATLENKGKALEVDGQLIKMHNTASGNALLHIHNDKTSDAAVLRLEGGRTADNDTGQILFANSDNLIAAIKTFRKSADDAGELRFYTSEGGAGIQQRAVILKSGYFGIGTTSPQSKLQVGSTNGGGAAPTGAISAVNNTGQASINFVSKREDHTTTQNVGGIFAEASGGWVSKLHFKTNNNWGNPAITGLTISSSGSNSKVGIGTTAPTNKLEVIGNVRVSVGGGDSYFGYGTNSDNYFSTGSSGKNVFRTAGTERMRITNTGNVVHQGSGGVEVFYAHGWVGGSTALSVDVPCDDDAGQGTVFHVEAAMTHHPSYDSILETWVSTRGTADVRSTEQYRRDTGGSGAWSVSRTSTTNLRVSKSAGTYVGGGPWWVRVTYRRT